MTEERLQKILASAGYGSRRANEALITAGRVRVNGQVAILGAKADPERDRITVDGQPVKVAEALVYVAVNKPRGVLSTVSADDRRLTVRDLVPLPGHLYPVGRLDVDSEGLILLTNDGELANRLTHPRYGHEKEYRVLVARQPDDEQLEAWRRGVVLEDGYRTLPAEVRVESLFGKGAWLRVILKEGRKRQIREVGGQLGLPVVRIIRVRIGSLLLGGLTPRDWRYVSPAEVAALKGKPAPKVPRAPKKQLALKRPPGRTPSQPGKGRPGPRKSGETGQLQRKAEKGRRR
jgi:23S rRNA pseudouridine2605 synthase